jgi:radical SAM protein (TIGR01212 family)
LRASRGAELFVAYFQPATNTYVGQDSILPCISTGSASTSENTREPLAAPPLALSRLRSVYEEALAHPAVVGLAIGTRPDCVPDPVLDLLAEFSDRTWLSVEYGLQTVHDRSLDWLNRGHHYDAFLDAVARSRQRNLEIGVHVILGLPGESRDDVLATARELARLRVDSVKLHNLYAVRETRLAEMVRAGQVRLPELSEYAGYVVDFLERLPPTCVIDRLAGDAPPQYLVAPAWCLDKAAVRAAVDAEFTARGTWQGARAEGSAPGLVQS